LRDQHGSVSRHGILDRARWIGPTLESLLAVHWRQTTGKGAALSRSPASG